MTILIGMPRNGDTFRSAPTTFSRENFPSEFVIPPIARRRRRRERFYEVLNESFPMGTMGCIANGRSVNMETA